MQPAAEDVQRGGLHPFARASLGAHIREAVHARPDWESSGGNRWVPELQHADVMRTQLGCHVQVDARGIEHNLARADLVVKLECERAVVPITHTDARLRGSYEWSHALRPEPEVIRVILAHHLDAWDLRALEAKVMNHAHVLGGLDVRVDRDDVHCMISLEPGNGFSIEANVRVHGRCVLRHALHPLVLARQRDDLHIGIVLEVDERVIHAAACMESEHRKDWPALAVSVFAGRRLCMLSAVLSNARHESHLGRQPGHFTVELEVAVLLPVCRAHAPADLDNGSKSTVGRGLGVCAQQPPVSACVLHQARRVARVRVHQHARGRLVVGDISAEHPPRLAEAKEDPPSLDLRDAGSDGVKVRNESEADPSLSARGTLGQLWRAPQWSPWNVTRALTCWRVVGLHPPAHARPSKSSLPLRRALCKPALALEGRPRAATPQGLACGRCALLFGASNSRFGLIVTGGEVL
mmetsp:Transcript_15268/g.39691  ORF Transcript_15268/g.39691 Transcript_15268/m.39691 type:complete len:466 (+) Transcript_15268:815-2212(+)